VTVGWRGALTAVLALAVIHVGLALVPGPGLSTSMNVALYATNLYVVYCAASLAQRTSGRHLGLFIVGYFVLFLLVMVILDRKPLFIILVVLYASVFRSTFLLGFYALFVLSFVVLQPYAAETFIPLALVYVVLWRARVPSRFHKACLGVGLVALAAVLFPLVHLVMQDSAQTLARTLGRPDVQEAVWVSIASSTTATAIVALFGVPLAYGMARSRFPGKRVLESIIDVPILVPQSVVGISMMVLLGPGSPLGSTLEASFGITVAGRFVGIVLAQVFVGAPFLIKTAMTAFEAVPPHLEMASRSLGASASTTFIRIALPLASRGIGVGMILAWARAISEFGSIILFASSPVTAPLLVHTEFLRAGAAESRPIATLLLVICLWIFVMLQFGQSLLPFSMQRDRGAR
jgi:molybdate/tungstate transport system permease protein